MGVLKKCQTDLVTRHSKMQMEHIVILAQKDRLGQWLLDVLVGSREVLTVFE